MKLARERLITFALLAVAIYVELDGDPMLIARDRDCAQSVIGPLDRDLSACDYQAQHAVVASEQLLSVVQLRLGQQDFIGHERAIEAMAMTTPHIFKPAYDGIVVR